jgi:serine protease AprX
MRRILPIAQRLRADERFAGRGVTIAFIDSGFYAHADLVTPVDRIVAYYDIVRRRPAKKSLFEPDVSSWHGLMTSVVACGNGALSDGRFRGIAHEAKLVLLKAGQTHRILHDDIRRGIEWAIQHRERYNIRILNISCGGDFEASYLVDGLSRAADAATRAGIVVVAAVGNAGHDPNARVLPPASAPSVITVGGFDDGGEGLTEGGYHSTFGPTIDGLQKPELIAPAIWLAAPVLPETPTAAQVKLLAQLQEADDGSLYRLLAEHPGVVPELDALAHREPYLIRELVAVKRRDEKVVSRHYKHVDGTSFSAPIVSSVVAQMLEANPRLTPQDVKTLLIRTARRLQHIPPERQGWGVVSPAAAVEAALRAPK